MTRLALISDLHGALSAVDSVLADIDAAGIDRIVCLGDVIDLGPLPAETLDRLRERNIPIVRGNHDPLDEHPEHKYLAKVEAWTRDRLGSERLAFLASRPLERVEDLAGTTVLCVHGSPHGMVDQVLAETPGSTLQAWWGDRTFDVLVCGHTHLPLVRRVDDRLIVNVGSVGQPFRAPFHGPPPRVLPWSEYAVISAGGGIVSAEIRRLPFDLTAYEQALRQAGFPDPDAWLSQWS